MESKLVEWRQAKGRLSLALLSYCLIAYLIHGCGHDITRILLGGGDGYTLGLPSKLFSATLSAWNPYVQLGEYAFANTQYQPFYLPGLIPLTVFPGTFGYNIFILGHYAMAGFFFFCFARNLPLGEYASYFGGVCFMCCGFMLAHKGHHAMLSAAVWLPLILLFVDRYARSLRLRDAGLGGLALAFSVLSGYPQITLYSAIVVSFYLGFRCLRLVSLPLSGRFRILAQGLTILFAVGVMLSSLQLFAVADTLPYITRQKISFEMFNEDFMPVHYLGLLFNPNMVGCFYRVPCFSAVINTVEIYPYSGLLPLMLALLALPWLRRTSADVIFWAIAVLTAAIVSLGLEPVQRVLYHVPIYNLFRAPGRHLFEVTFGICVLAAYGMDALLSRNRARDERPARTTKWSAVTVGLFVLGVSIGLQVLRYVLMHPIQPGFAQFGQRLLKDMYPYADKPGLIAAALAVWRPTILYPLICFAVSWLVLSKLALQKMPALWKTAALSIVLLDVWLPYHFLYDNPDTANLYEPASEPEIAYIEKQGFDHVRYRIYPVAPGPRQSYPLLNMMHRLSVINDYSPMWSIRYQSVTNFYLNGAAITPMFATKVMDSLGVKFLIVNNAILAHYLRWVTRFAPAPKSPLPLPALSCAGLYCSSAEFPAPGVIVLGARAENGVSLIQIPVAFEPNTGYEVSFEGRSEGEEAGWLHLDLYSIPGEWAGLGAGDVQSFVALGPAFTKNVLSLDSSRAVAKNGFVRLITTSRARMEIRNLTLAKVRPGPKAYKEVFGAPDGAIVFENPSALPRFRFATELVPVASLSEARAITVSATFDPAKQATVEGLPAGATVDTGKILSEQIGNDSMAWTVETGNRSFFVVADSWFPGWIARVDGREVDIHIVNGFLRGIFVEGPGQHRIQMDFRPRSVVHGLVVTIAGGILLAGMWILSSFRERRRAPAR